MSEANERKLLGRINPAEYAKIIFDNFGIFYEAGKPHTLTMLLRYLLKFWWRRVDLNHWPSGYEPLALPDWATPPSFAITYSIQSSKQRTVFALSIGYLGFFWRSLPMGKSMVSLLASAYGGLSPLPFTDKSHTLEKKQVFFFSKPLFPRFLTISTI